MNFLSLAFLLCIIGWSRSIPTPPPHAKAYGRRNMTVDTEQRLEKELGDLDERLAKMKAVASANGKHYPTKQSTIEQPVNRNHSHLHPLGDSIAEVNSGLGVAPYFFDGDMDLTDEQMGAMIAQAFSSDGFRKKRQMSTSVYPKWTNGAVYYYLDPSLSTRKINSISAALSSISSQTCINFYQSTTAANRIRAFNGTGCYSNIGMTGGVQSLSIGDGCEVIGTVAHEFTHALGSFHMHQRYDRDSYIKVNLTYVDPSQQSNFAIPPSGQMVTPYFTPFEYGSMMQYSADSFTQSGQVSMTPYDSNHLYTMGNRMISFYDLYMINQEYGCNAKCPSATSVSCWNGGYPNPRNCSVCICPSGFTGTRCGLRPTGNGGLTLNATTVWQNYTITLGTNTTTDPAYVRDTYMVRVDWIQAPTGHTIQIGLAGSMYNEQCMYGCVYNGIEFKLYNQTASGVKFCCTNYLNYYWQSSLNPAPVMAFNRYYFSQFTVIYRYV